MYTEKNIKPAGCSGGGPGGGCARVFPGAPAHLRDPRRPLGPLVWAHQLQAKRFIHQKSQK